MFFSIFIDAGSRTSDAVVRSSQRPPSVTIDFDDEYSRESLPLMIEEEDEDEIFQDDTEVGRRSTSDRIEEEEEEEDNEEVTPLLSQSPLKSPVHGCGRGLLSSPHSSRRFELHIQLIHFYLIAAITNT